MVRSTPGRQKRKQPTEPRVPENHKPIEWLRDFKHQHELRLAEMKRDLDGFKGELVNNMDLVIATIPKRIRDMPLSEFVKHNILQIEDSKWNSSADNEGNEEREVEGSENDMFDYNESNGDMAENSGNIDGQQKPILDQTITTGRMHQRRDRDAPSFKQPSSSRLQQRKRDATGCLMKTPAVYGQAMNSVPMTITTKVPPGQNPLTVARNIQPREVAYSVRGSAVGLTKTECIVSSIIDGSLRDANNLTPQSRAELKKVKSVFNKFKI